MSDSCVSWKNVTGRRELKTNEANNPDGEGR
jgi:hypothetical protein